MLHLLNGDATAAVFPDSLSGERGVWRDILMEGPAGAGAEARAAWLAPRLGITADAYARGWREGEATLARAREHDEVVLWFEQDMFCATNLWFVLDRLAAASVSLVFPALGKGPLGAGFKGLGTLATDAFAPLFEQRQRLSAAAFAQARGLWRAYAAPEPTALVRLEPALPFARHAIRLHCGRFPSVGRGLDEVEQAALAALAAPLAFSALFRAVAESAALAESGLGDVQFAAALRDLAVGGRRRPRRPREPPRPLTARSLARRRAPGARRAALALGHEASGARRGRAILMDAPEKIGRSPAVATRREESPGSTGQGAG